MRRLDVFPETLRVFIAVRFFGFGDKAAEIFGVNQIRKFGIQLVSSVAVEQKILLQSLAAVESFANLRRFFFADQP